MEPTGEGDFLLSLEGCTGFLKTVRTFQTGEQHKGMTDSDRGLRVTQCEGEHGGGEGPHMQGLKCWDNMEGNLEGVKTDGVQRPCGQNFIYWPPTMCRPL